MPQHLDGYFPDIKGNHPLIIQKNSNSFTLSKLEEKTIRDALQRHRGNKTKTAKALGIGRATLYRKLKDVEI